MFGVSNNQRVVMRLWVTKVTAVLFPTRTIAYDPFDDTRHFFFTITWPLVVVLVYRTFRSRFFALVVAEREQPFLHNRLANMFLSLYELLLYSTVCIAGSMLFHALCKVRYFDDKLVRIFDIAVRNILSEIEKLSRHILNFHVALWNPLVTSGIRGIFDWEIELCELHDSTIFS